MASQARAPDFPSLVFLERNRPTPESVWIHSSFYKLGRFNRLWRWDGTTWERSSKPMWEFDARKAKEAKLLINSKKPKMIKPRKQWTPSGKPRKKWTSRNPKSVNIPEEWGVVEALTEHPLLGI